MYSWFASKTNANTDASSARNTVAVNYGDEEQEARTSADEIKLPEAHSSKYLSEEEVSAKDGPGKPQSYAEHQSRVADAEARDANAPGTSSPELDAREVNIAGQSGGSLTEAAVGSLVEAEAARDTTDASQFVRHKESISQSASPHQMVPDGCPVSPPKPVRIGRACQDYAEKPVESRNAEKIAGVKSRDRRFGDPCVTTDPRSAYLVAETSSDFTGHAAPCRTCGLVPDVFADGNRGHHGHGIRLWRAASREGKLVDGSRRALSGDRRGPAESQWRRQASGQERQNSIFSHKHPSSVFNSASELSQRLKSATGEDLIRRLACAGSRSQRMTRTPPDGHSPASTPSGFRVSSSAQNLAFAMSPKGAVGSGRAVRTDQSGSGHTGDARSISPEEGSAESATEVAISTARQMPVSKMPPADPQTHGYAVKSISAAPAESSTRDPPAEPTNRFMGWFCCFGGSS